MTLDELRTLLAKFLAECYGPEPTEGGWERTSKIEFRVNPAGGGKLVICGFDFMGKNKWDASPTPRYLFARLLEYLTEKNAPEAIEERKE